jgi:hypothetical protein
MPPSRNDIETTTVPCPVCGRPFNPIRRQRYCSAACRQAAWRVRHFNPALPPPIVVGPRKTRRDVTIYQCLECESRYLAEQWCYDCNKPCIRIGPGGLCPHCDEPVAISDITNQHTTPPSAIQ